VLFEAVPPAHQSHKSHLLHELKNPFGQISLNAASHGSIL